MLIIITPEKLRPQALESLHKGHLDISYMHSFISRWRLSNYHKNVYSDFTDFIPLEDLSNKSIIEIFKESFKQLEIFNVHGISRILD